MRAFCNQQFMKIIGTPPNNPLVQIHFCFLIFKTTHVFQRMSAGGWKAVETGYPKEDDPPLPEGVREMGRFAGAKQAFLRQATVSDEEKVGYISAVDHINNVL